MATFSLSAKGDRITPVDEDEAIRIVEQMRKVCDENAGATLTKVDLSCRTYREEGADIIASFFSPELVQNVTTFKGDDMIASVPEKPALCILKRICDIFRNSPLEVVNLSDNALGSKGLEACDSVLGQQKGLKELYLLNNGIATESMELLRDMLAGSEHLETLHFHNNMVGPEGAVHFAEIVASCPSLSDIRYTHVRAGVEGTRVVCEALVANTDFKLEKLDLSGCKLFHEEEPDGIECMCEFLRTKCESLTHLDISDCELTDDGMIPIAEALLESAALLVSLNVAENELTAESCRLLAEALEKLLPSLQVLNCETNEMTSKGVKYLMAPFTASKVVALRILNFNTNGIGHKGAVALAQAHLPAIETVELSGNGFPLRDVTRLQTAFGDALEEMEDNYSDEDFDAELSDDEDEEIEEEQDEANNENVEEDSDEEIEVGLLSQALGNL